MGWRDVKWLPVPAAGVVLFFAGTGCVSPPSKPVVLTDTNCPHTWIVEGDTLRLAVVGPKTNTPEFHDCQRFINPGGQGYGPLAAIFRADSLLGQRFDPMPDAGPVPAIPPDAAMASAVIFMIDGFYERLRLMRGFNCLYLWGPVNRLEATMVSVGENEADCKRRLGSVPQSDHRRLPVNMVRIAGTEGFTRADVPEVARWDWDERHFYFMSLSCGDFWCEVGSPDPGAANAGGFTNKAAVRYSVTPAAVRNNRIARINGWYDEQHLAAPVAGPPTPTTLKGTVFPHPDLGSYRVESFATWQPVAFVALGAASTGYQQKFGWREAAAGGMAAPLPVGGLGAVFNTISFCRGTRDTCRGASAVPVSADCPAGDGDVWFARSEAPTQGTEPTAPVYKCVKYRPHVPGFDIPPVTRWRWREDDETLWVRCPQGCCEYEPT